MLVGRKIKTSSCAVMQRNVIICTTMNLRKQKKMDLEVVNADSWLCFEVLKCGGRTEEAFNIQILVD